jgi:cell wall assembly regulator SMI1
MGARNIMAAQEFVWENCGPPVDNSRIQEIERTLLVEFPEDYRNTVKRCNGGSPSKQRFTFSDSKGTMTGCLAALLSYTEENPENIIKMNKMLEDQLPRHVICIGEDGGGDFICFDFRAVPTQSKSPTVVYWHHETDEISFLNNTFSGFLGMLR